MQLSVETVTKSKSGKALRIKAGGAWYGARLNAGLEKAVGKTIEAEVQHDETYGDQIGAWKIIEGSTPPAQQKNGNGASANGAPAWLPFASNTVAHAINAGLITDPAQVSKWAQSAKEAFEALA